MAEPVDERPVKHAIRFVGHTAGPGVRRRPDRTTRARVADDYRETDWFLHSTAG